MKAVVILSGGMDSSITAYMAKKDGYEIIAVHFNYGQRTEQKELEAFRAIAGELNAKTYEIDLPFFEQIGASALIDTNIAIPKQGIEPGIPVTYVPFRNGIFLSVAAAIAEKEGADSIYIGVVEEDSSGYPDCREDFIQKMESAINAGTKPETDIKIKTPLIHLRKEDIVQLGLSLGVPLEKTWSCYESEDEACGECDSCRLRLKGFEKAGAKDKIPYKST
ncbi:7-cyano-7-deazaguanine synthase QueC [Nitratiruptor sp. SB155-2]|uniref:7-cyano-7-deazaguanine synthase n=1 Tax=Nitratiruptor sp. (strain SB155-2) TaxID=387092 RepID=QUEC_NITSB|nr:7-cyano-7-deazaguanine synthase QueC [Nitratiruptor sp. SB155-2]A6Q342.1 RecName: Full=7-cyano-7-deazaguanine synthase; AltName: Full=7-cyano-7-carbaguanine synthase; AltName: Full=PreQ(0) synthase; AltName: Full=Queuosine biosynthesis protein QueC [Nitratiruptor sp. SB155-2]BAF69901.1 transcriptional regulator, ExsB family [Nitratiruptor sp. SB155-2]